MREKNKHLPGLQEGDFWGAYVQTPDLSGGYIEVLCGGVCVCVCLRNCTLRIRAFDGMLIGRGCQERGAEGIV